MVLPEVWVSHLHLAQSFLMAAALAAEIQISSLVEMVVMADLVEVVAVLAALAALQHLGKGTMAVQEPLAIRAVAVAALAQRVPVRQPMLVAMEAMAYQVQ